MPSFNVGDIVTGIPRSSNEYGFTNEDAIMKVIEIEEQALNLIGVKIIAMIDGSPVGTHGIYRVNNNLFKLYTGDLSSQNGVTLRQILQQEYGDKVKVVQ